MKPVILRIVSLDHLEFLPITEEMFGYLLAWGFVSISMVFIWIQKQNTRKHARTDSKTVDQCHSFAVNEQSIALPIQAAFDPLVQEQEFTLIDVEGAPNLRGFGGYRSTVGNLQQTRRSILYRSAHPGGMSTSAVKQIKSMGIRTIVNIASHSETTVPWKIPRKSLEGEGFVFLDWPIEKEAFSIDQLLKKYEAHKKDGVNSVSQNYIQLLQNGSAVIRRILLLLKENPNQAVLIHCTLGKDRTGMIFALLFLLVGVPDVDIVKEYGLSTKGLASCVDSIETYLKEVTGKSDGQRKQAEEIILAGEENMIATINAIRTVYGTVEAYLIRECGFTDEEIGDLKSHLLCSAP